MAQQWRRRDFVNACLEPGVPGGAGGSVRASCWTIFLIEPKKLEVVTPLSRRYVLTDRRKERDSQRQREHLPRRG